MLGRVCWPLNMARAGVTAGAAAVFALSAILFEKVFLLVHLRGEEWAALAGLTALGVAAYILTAWLERKLAGRRKAG